MVTVTRAVGERPRNFVAGAIPKVTSTRSRLQVCCVVAATCAALVVAFFGEHVARAQGGDNDYVDVGLILEVPDHPRQGLNHKLSIIVVNKGTVAAHDVEVIVSIDSPATLSHFHDEPVLIIGSRSPEDLAYPPIGSVSLESEERSLRWSIPAIKAGLQRLEHLVGVTHKGIVADPPAFDHTQDPHGFLGRVTTSSFESDHHKGDNTSRVWSYREDGSGQWWQAAGNYSVVVSVDNPSPSPGDTVNFTIATDRAARDRDNDRWHYAAD